MMLNQKTLMDTYSHKETAELQSLYNSRDLTSEAYDTLENILRSRGIEPPKKPTLSEEDLEEKPVDGWVSFMTEFVGAFALCVLGHRIFLPDLPSTVVVMPGSLREIVFRLIGDSMAFIAIFLTVSIPILVFSRLSRKPGERFVPRLLKIALVVTLLVEGLLLLGAWYGSR